jgi:hypothetical protein
MEITPLDPRELLAMIMGMLVVLIPLTGFTVRFATRPRPAALLCEGSHDRQVIEMLERRVALLEQELRSLNDVREEMARVLEEADFQG